MVTLYYSIMEYLWRYFLGYLSYPWAIVHSMLVQLGMTW